MKNPNLEKLAQQIREKVDEMNSFLAVWKELQQLHEEAEKAGLKFSFSFPFSGNRIGDEISLGRMAGKDTY